MVKNKSKKISSSQSLKENTIDTTPLYAEAVVEVKGDSLYNAFNVILISLFTLCLIYAVIDIASKIFAQ